MLDLVRPTILISEAERVPVPSFLFYFGIVLLVMFGLMAYAKPALTHPAFFRGKMSEMKTMGLGDRARLWLLHCFEHLYLFIQNLCVGIIGPHGIKYVPMIMTFWMVIFIANVLGLFAPTTPTALLGFNLGMALISIGYVQFEGMRVNGVLGHLKHFKGPDLPIAMAIIISPLIFCIEIVSEIMKNVSLSLRLFGNIHGGHEAVKAMNVQGASYFVPWGSFLLPIKLMTCVVQALIFSLLTCVYISLVTAHQDEHGHHEEGGH